MWNKSENISFNNDAYLYDKKGFRVVSEKVAILINPFQNMFKQFISSSFFLILCCINAQQHEYSYIKLPDGSLLSDKGNPNLVLVIGQSTCPACQSDHYALERYYPRWKSKGFSVVYLSIDHEVADYTAYYCNDPWETHHDSLRWEGTLATKLKLMGTPSLYAFDKDMMLLKEAENAHQMHYWIESTL